MFALVLIALTAFAGAILLYAAGFPALVPVHLAFASGALPLIGGAILHFVPVLTRSATPGRSLRALPVLLLIAGLLAFASFAFSFSAASLPVAAALGIAGAGTLAVWILRLSRKSVGRPHPGLYWYLGAMVCLLFGLSSVLLMRLWPEQYLALRRFHLHINTLGFIGITAVGTLQVLLPTVAGRPDAGAARRLRADLKWVLAGTLLIATGAAWQRLLVWPGLVLWMIPLLRLGAGWTRIYRKELVQWSGGTVALAGALPGLMAAFALGAAHGTANGPPASQAGVAYALIFLLPLVTGAAGHLLPLWVRPGVQTQWHLRARQALARYSAIRVLLFIGAGAMTAWGIRFGWVPAAAGLVLFAVQLPVLASRRPGP